MITREEYNKALDVVEAYQEQVFKCSVSENLRKKTPIEEWEKLDLCTGHLWALMRLSRNKLLPIKPGEKVYYIEDLTWKDFKKTRGLGKKSWEQFVEIRGF